MKRYIKEISGRNVIKSRSQITIDNNGMTTYNPTEEMILADGWVEFQDQVYEETVDDIRRQKMSEVEQFDLSNEVNCFYVNDIPMWLDKNTRSGLMLRFSAELGMGKETTSLWYEGIEFPLPLDVAIQMLYAIEVYASNCYDNTQKHLSIISKLETKEEIERYDYKVDYPEKLRF